MRMSDRPRQLLHQSSPAARVTDDHLSRSTGEVANGVAGEGIFFRELTDVTIHLSRLPTPLPLVSLAEAW
jgi:hypothetical protein